ncbi:hypothetical protein [Scytonema sp. NUACC21]
MKIFIPSAFAYTICNPSQDPSAFSLLKEYQPLEDVLMLKGGEN